jgi:hypothetical protein
MKKEWNSPALVCHGQVEQLTQATKTLGSSDGNLLVIPGLTPPSGVPIRDQP